ncbi:hypothetical protein ACFE04_019365 [Oxalis oulophora]
MASTFLKYTILSIIVAILTSRMIQASDPNILSDFLPQNTTSPDASFFTFTQARTLFTSEFPQEFKDTKIGMTEFPALEGQSVSLALLQFPAGGLNPPNTHPRSSGLLLVIKGSLDVGFVDTTNKLFTQKLQTGDIFVFPKGLVHYQYNSGDETAMAVSCFGSANAGTVSVPTTVFGTGIDAGILAKAFKTDLSTIQKIKAGLAAKA